MGEPRLVRVRAGVDRSELRGHEVAAGWDRDGRATPQGLRGVGERVGGDEAVRYPPQLHGPPDDPVAQSAVRGQGPSGDHDLSQLAESGRRFTTSYGGRRQPGAHRRRGGEAHRPRPPAHPGRGSGDTASGSSSTALAPAAWAHAAKRPPWSAATSATIRRP